MPKKTPSGKSSDAWKEFEKAYVKELLAGGVPAHRETRGHDYGEEGYEIVIPDLPFLKVDSKYRNGGWNHHTVLEQEIERKYCKSKSDEPVMPTKSGKQRGSYTTIRSSFFIRLLWLAFFRKRTTYGAWTCNNCDTPYTIEKQVMGGLNKFTCPGCQNVIYSEHDGGVK